MKGGVGAIKDDAFEAKLFGGGFKIADGEAFIEGIDKGEADHLAFVPCDVLAQIFVDLVGGGSTKLTAAARCSEASRSCILTLLICVWQSTTISQSNSIQDWRGPSTGSTSSPQASSGQVNPALPISQQEYTLTAGRKSVKGKIA